MQYGSVLTAGYTGDDLRAWKQGNAGKTYYLYDGISPVCELNGSGSVTGVNTFGGNGVLSRHTSAGNAFYTFDLEGNVAQRLGGGSSVLSTDEYNGFGARQSTGNMDCWGYGGKWGYYTDVETGLCLCTLRFYDPNGGHFLTRDPIGYNGGVNLYAYCQNQPVDRADAVGTNWFTDLFCRHFPTICKKLKDPGEQPEPCPTPPSAPGHPEAPLPTPPKECADTGSAPVLCEDCLNALREDCTQDSLKEGAVGAQACLNKMTKCQSMFCEHDGEGIPHLGAKLYACFVGLGKTGGGGEKH